MQNIGEATSLLLRYALEKLGCGDRAQSSCVGSTQREVGAILGLRLISSEYHAWHNDYIIAGPHPN